MFNVDQTHSTCPVKRLSNSLITSLAKYGPGKAPTSLIRWIDLFCQDFTDIRRKLKGMKLKPPFIRTLLTCGVCGLSLAPPSVIYRLGFFAHKLFVTTSITSCMLFGIFIGPESDHWLCLSLIPYLAH